MKTLFLAAVLALAPAIVSAAGEDVFTVAER